MLKKSCLKMNPASCLSFSLEREKKMVSVTLAQDQSGHVMWELLFTGLEIRGGEQKSCAEDNWAGKKSGTA